MRDWEIEFLKDDIRRLKNRVDSVERENRDCDKHRSDWTVNLAWWLIGFLWGAAAMATYATLSNRLAM